jgi:Protein of unknown function (DUF2846)
MNSSAFRALLMGAFLVGCVESTPTTEPVPVDGQTESANQGAAPETSDQSGLLKLPEGKARIVVYRGNTFGLAPNIATPQVKLDGSAVGKCKHNAPVVRDLAAGTYEVTVQTDLTASKTVTVAAGEVQFLRCNVLPIGLLLPSPALDLVLKADVPKSVLIQAGQP